LPSRPFIAWQTAPPNRKFFAGPRSPESARIADLLLENNVIRSIPDIDTLHETSYLSKAMKPKRRAARPARRFHCARSEPMTPLNPFPAAGALRWGWRFSPLSLVCGRWRP